MNNPKILFVCDKNECTSFGRLTLNLAKAVSSRYEAHVLWLKTPKFFPDDAKRDVLGSGDGACCEFHETWAKSLYTGFFSFRRPLKKIICELNPDVVFLIRPELGFLVPVARNAASVAAKENGRSVPAKTIMFVHDTFAETLYPHSLKFKFLNVFYIRDCVKADSFVFNSEWTRKNACEYFGTNMSTRPGSVIGCPIDRDLFNRPSSPVADEERRAFRRRHGMRNFSGMCLNVSLDEPRKNIDTYFEMARLRPDVAFVRVGKVSERLRNLINEKKLYNVFHFERFRPAELRDFYRHADLMVYPSFLEGFGLPPIEAIACGTPALCAATSAVRENLEGVCPLIDPPTDALAYAEVLDRVLARENIMDDALADKLLERCSMAEFAKRVVAAVEQ